MTFITGISNLCTLFHIKSKARTKNGTYLQGRYLAFMAFHTYPGYMMESGDTFITGITYAHQMLCVHFFISKSEQEQKMVHFFLTDIWSAKYDCRDSLSFLFITKWNSIWFKINMKTVTTIIFYTNRKETKLYFL